MDLALLIPRVEVGIRRYGEQERLADGVVAPKLNNRMEMSGKLRPATGRNEDLWEESDELAGCVRVTWIRVGGRSGTWISNVAMPGGKSLQSGTIEWQFAGRCRVLIYLEGSDVDGDVLRRSNAGAQK
jgi:hypothetical protein